jgi:hypothetical protein
MGGILQVDTIQNNNTSNLITQTNVTTITIGTSGQNISIPSGATLTGPGAGLIWQSVQTTSFTAVKGKAYPVNTTSGEITVTLPATPSAGDQVQVVDYAGTFDTNKLTIVGNGEDIEGGALDFQLTGDREGVILTYIDSTQGWIATSGINEGTDALTPILIVDFLVVAGGAGGGGTTLNVGAVGGGGGAGGYRNFTSQTLAVATNYTVTVGAGGAGGAQLNNSDGSPGSNSVFSTNTSTGGGGGGGGNQAGAANVGVNGGSGGGGGGGSPGANGGTGNTPSTSPSQGNNGAASPGSGTGGGGGGSNAAGSASAGGSGTASSITGSSVTRAAGGSGGTGSGQGVIPTAKGANTGDGGGGGFGAGGGAGGSGIVIVKYPDVFTITNPGGGLTSSTSSAGGFKVTSFTAGTGTIQFN